MQVAFCQARALPAAACGSGRRSSRSSSLRLQQQGRVQGSATAAVAAAASTASGSLPHARRAGSLRCQAAAEASDIIDVDGKVVDDRVPVTVSWGEPCAPLPPGGARGSCRKPCTWVLRPSLPFLPLAPRPGHHRLPGQR